LQLNEALLVSTRKEAGDREEGAIMVLPEEMERIAFLHDLGQPYLGRLAALAQLKEYRAGAVLFSEGEASPVIYFILTGEVKLLTEQIDGEPFTLYTAGPGEMIGWSPLLGRSAMTATARASSLSRLAVLDARQVMKLCEQDPYFGMAFLRQVMVFLSDRLASTRRCLAFARALGHCSPFALAHDGSD
jgi:CRP-like cAMP-binding protein